LANWICVLRPEELGRQFELSGARFVVTLGMFLPNVKQAAELCGTIEKIIVLGMAEVPTDCTDFKAFVMGDDGSLYGKKRGEGTVHTDVVAMPFSSGTTGPPKGVCLTHFNLVANCAQVGGTN
jgi:4-coumarate--CoA ligase